MSERIVSRSFSKQGRDNWDKIFKKTKKALKDQQVNPMIPKEEIELKKCDLCGELTPFYGHIC